MVKNFFNYLQFGIIWWLGWLPLPVLYFIADFLFVLLFYFPGYRKRVVLDNLRNSFPEKSTTEINSIARKFYLHLCDLTAEIIRIFHMPKKELHRRFTFNDHGLLADLHTKNRNFILVSGHYNNWEWTYEFPALFDFTSLVVYMPAQNLLFDKQLNKVRSQYGAHLITLNESYRKILACHKKGGHYMVGLVADQSPPPEARYWTTFLNQETAFFLGIEKLSKKFDLAVIYMKIQKIKRGYYEASFDMLVDDPINTQPNEIVDKFIKKLEDEIRESPEYWLWSHKRWKHKRGDKE